MIYRKRRGLRGMIFTEVCKDRGKFHTALLYEPPLTYSRDLIESQNLE